MARIVHPGSLREASQILADDPEAMALGGGTAIQIMRKLGFIDPPMLVDLGALPELRGLRNEDGVLRIGAMTTHREVERSPVARSTAPLLCETYEHVANVRVRHTATVGGNLAHGDYRLDPPAALLALQAEILLAGPTGERVLPLNHFFVGLEESALQPGELIVEIRVPTVSRPRSSHFVKLATLGANDWPCVSVAAVLEWDTEDRLAAARLGVSAMAATPFLVEVGAAVGLSQTSLADAALDAVLAAADPVGDFRGSEAYKRRACAAVVRDALAGAWVGEKEGVT